MFLVAAWVKKIRYLIFREQKYLINVQIVHICTFYGKYPPRDGQHLWSTGAFCEKMLEKYVESMF